MGKRRKRKAAHRKPKKTMDAKPTLDSSRGMDSFAFIGELDDDGFLKVKIRFARVGVLPYMASEVRGFEHLEPDAVVYVLRDDAELFSSESIASIEGRPLLAGHEWAIPGDSSPLSGQDGNSSILQVGAVAGTPMRDGDFLMGKGLITNMPIIDAIQNLERVEISPGFIHDVEVREGIWRGVHYDAVFKNIRYNHIALLPPGQARGGPDLRIIQDKNQKQTKGDEKMANDLIRMKTKHGIVSTDEAGARIVQASMDAEQAIEEELKTAKDQMEGLAEKVDRIAELDAQLAEIKAERDKLAGELDMVKAELEKISSPEVMQEAVEALAESQEVAAEVLGADSLPANWKKLPAKELKKHVVISRLTAQGKSVDAAKVTDDYINGAWELIKDHVSNGRGKFVPVAGVMDGCGGKGGRRGQRTAEEILQIGAFSKTQKKS